MDYYVYILCSERKGTLYTGITNDISRRVYEHKNKVVKGFTCKYRLNKLVYVKIYSDVSEALHREKCLKKWNRAWKLRLIEEANPEWSDLYETSLL